jgi:hypothetical protein
MKKQCGFLLLYVVVAVLLLPLLLTILCGGLGQELPQEAQVLYGLADLAPLDTELEEYVAGVVAAEMPAAFPEEALKAQAVAARTYQVRQMQAAGSRAVLYDVGQAYLSEAEQKEKWGEGYALYAGKIHSAVRATAGEIMTYDGEPILAAFHAQSGGRTEDAAHDLAHAEVGGGEQHAAKEQQERPVDKQLVGFRIRAVRLPEKDEKTDGPHQPEQVAAGFQERLHRHPGIGVDLHEADPFFTAAFRAAGQIVGEDGLAAGALQFALDFDLDGSGGRRAARDQALAAERRFGPHAAASVVCVVRACCM